jgi:hypothetical protein
MLAQTARGIEAIYADLDEALRTLQHRIDYYFRSLK